MSIGLVKVDSWASIHTSGSPALSLRIDCDPNLWITHPQRESVNLFTFAMQRLGLISIPTIASRLPALNDWQMRPDECNEDQYVVERLRDDREEPELIADGVTHLPEGWIEAVRNCDNWTRVYVTNTEVPVELQRPSPDKDLGVAWMERAGLLGRLWGGAIPVRI